MLHLVFKVSSTCSHTRSWSSSPHSANVQQIGHAWCRYLDEKTFTSLIPALKWMVSINETYCLREIFCPILSSTRITSHFSKTEPQRIELAKLSNSWKSRRQTSFHQIYGHPTAPISTMDYKICGILQERVYMTSSKDVDALRRRIAEEWDKLD